MYYSIGYFCIFLSSFSKRKFDVCINKIHSHSNAVSKHPSSRWISISFGQFYIVDSCEMEKKISTIYPNINWIRTLECMMLTRLCLCFFCLILNFRSVSFQFSNKKKNKMFTVPRICVGLVYEMFIMKFFQNKLY